jgi:probable phosphoglycerate mutase
MELSSRQILLIRHGETEWSRTGRHTGRTDVPLTEEGKRRAEILGRHLCGRKLRVWTSPLARARETCRLAGFEEAAIDPDLREWDYGIYEGRTTADLRKEQPDWSVWTAPIENGESLEQVARRAAGVIARVLETNGEDVALFAHGHILRVLAACWIESPPLTARRLALDTASISILGYERQTRVIRQWNFVTEA